MLKKFFCSWTRQSASTFSNWRKKSNGNVLDVSRSPISWVFKIFKTSSKFMNLHWLENSSKYFRNLVGCLKFVTTTATFSYSFFCYSKPVFAPASTAKVSFAVIRVCWHRTILVWQVLSFFPTILHPRREKQFVTAGKDSTKTFLTFSELI